MKGLVKANAHLARSGTDYQTKRIAEVTVQCSCGCGQDFQRPSGAVNAHGPNYISLEHMGRHRTQIYLEDMCGSFLSVIKEYLDGFCRQHYKNQGTIRAAVCPFILFLNERGITDLENVTPKTVTEFISWATEVDYKSSPQHISVLNGFFKWALRHGHRKSGSPVIAKFHGKKRAQHLPRPYTAEEMTIIWALAEERGNSRLRAIIAIGEESGLRLGEICRLREEDVDLVGHRLFVRLPNKTDCERWAPFSDKTARYILEWRSERDDKCGHDFLFHNSLGDPPRADTMHRELCRTFCKIHGGTQVNPSGLDEWSTHRLRHTMASRLASGGASFPTIMAAGGWKSPSSMMHYTKVDADQARHGYDQAMRRAEEKSKTGRSKHILSPGDFLAAYGENA
ncbi:tyrosine-type recombinase/integrase [Granulicella tundricola]|uniref:Integrase family protein n=1 Tax=Granulicella tundricola (strain ATCC BAA-1859 / DSM 23138 / MP5ACTX9) TaxID=1198114 RepID=E8X4Y1_GRATM|nr:tyrosine-type recombinase/integrase [Granulicella tundricola]ADW67173.1 integrase family protein [Granulicella tundricola MP5ACTX9]